MLSRSTKARSERAEQPDLTAGTCPTAHARSRLLQSDLAASCAAKECVTPERVTTGKRVRAEGEGSFFVHGRYIN